jgi:hypothetical protein
MRVLEGQADALAGTFKALDVANTLWAYAKMGREPGAGLMRGLEGRAEALWDTFNAQIVANTLWAYATMGREPGAGRTVESSDEVGERCVVPTGLHLVCCIRCAKQQLVSRRRILKYSMYTMIQALELRATAGHG